MEKEKVPDRTGNYHTQARCDSQFKQIGTKLSSLQEENMEPVQVERFYLGYLAHASYMIGSEGVAAVIDPQRDVDIYIEAAADRKSTRLNSSHRCISYAVFCLKKKKHYPSRWELQ